MDYKNNRLTEISIELRRDYGLVVGEGIIAGKLGTPLAQWFAEKFNQNFDAYDSAIDAVYNETHIGGSAYHHLLDGSHTIGSAFNAVKDVRTDDGWAKELLEASEHLLRDTASVSGINPFFGLTPEQFNSIGDFVSNFGISKTYLADALTFNAPELLGGVVALGGALILGKKATHERLSYFAGGSLLSTFVSANPVLLPIAAGSMCYAVSKSENKKQAFVEAGKGAIVSGSTILMSTLIGGPAYLGLISGVLAAVAVSKGLEKLSNATDLNQKFIEKSKEIIKAVDCYLDDMNPNEKQLNNEIIILKEQI
jgi:hypothetical protein